MDAIEFLRKQYGVTPSKTLVEVVGKLMHLDHVIRMMDKYADLKVKEALESNKDKTLLS